MVAIPLPFIVSFMLALLASIIYLRQDLNGRPAVLFLALCAITTAIAGLRWTTDIPLFRALLPISASMLPAAAWYCFARAHGKARFQIVHLLAPIGVLLASLTYPFWQPPIDPVLTLLFVGYGLALLKLSLKTDREPTQVRLADIQRALTAERIAGVLLLMSATIDSTLALDFRFYQGQHAELILGIGYALILPILALLVAFVSDITPASTDAQESLDYPENTAAQPLAKATPNTLSAAEAKAIYEQVDAIMRQKKLYLDPDLTLDRLARNAVIPARQISAAINQICKRNISQVINEYRIKHAQHLLATTNDSITQVYLNSGFQTKSNFNREFSRIVSQTPSAYRRSVQ